MQFIKSSLLRRAGYDEEAEVLRIEFQSGAVCDYLGVPWIVADQLLETPFAAKFYNDLVRDIYPHTEQDFRKAS